jgi:hypothetical protein
MFNRARVEASSFGICFSAGVVIGIYSSRNNYDIYSVLMPIMAIYAGLRFPGDIDQRISRTLGVVLGMYVGANLSQALRNNILHPPVRRLG